MKLTMSTLFASFLAANMLTAMAASGEDPDIIIGKFFDPPDEPFKDALWSVWPSRDDPCSSNHVEPLEILCGTDFSVGTNPDFTSVVLVCNDDGFPIAVEPTIKGAEPTWQCIGVDAYNNTCEFGVVFQDVAVCGNWSAIGTFV